MIVKDIIEKIEEISPQNLAESYDNVGLLVGGLHKTVSKVYIALDLDRYALEDALRFGADMIITHHPLIFHPIKSVRDDDALGMKIITLVKNNIACYAAHTNFDTVIMGVLAANKLGLSDIGVLDESGTGCIGALKTPVTLGECAVKVKNVFAGRVGEQVIRVYGDKDKIIKRAAVCPGSGKSYMDAAFENGADVYISGDIKYADALGVIESGKALIDVGHYAMEEGLFVPAVKEYLEKSIPDISISCAATRNPFFHCKR